MASVAKMYVELEGGGYHFSIGQELTLTEHGHAQGFGTAGQTRALIEEIEDNDHEPDAEIVISKRGDEHQNWEDGRWLTLWVGDLIRFFSVDATAAGAQVVNRDFMFKKQNLKGMKCKILARLGRRDVFVEMENNIGGGSCDGQGKQGHCIPIKKEFLTPSSREEKKSKGGQ